MVEVFMSFLSAAFCISAAFLSHQSDFSARVRFCSSLQASLYATVVDLVLLVCNTLWLTWSLLLIRVCCSWSLGSIQSWCFLSALACIYGYDPCLLQITDYFICVKRKLMACEVGSQLSTNLLLRWFRLWQSIGTTGNSFDIQSGQ